MRSVARRTAAVVVALLLFGACGQDDRRTALGGGAVDQIGKAHRVAIEAALRNAAVAQETYFAMNGRYAASVGELTASGLTTQADVALTIASATESAFCVQATHTALEGVTLHVANAGAIEDGPC